MTGHAGAIQRDDIATLADDLVAVGAKAGLRVVRSAKAKDWQAPHLVSSRQCDGERPASETQVVLEMFVPAAVCRPIHWPIGVDPVSGNTGRDESVGSAGPVTDVRC